MSDFEHRPIVSDWKRANEAASRKHGGSGDWRVILMISVSFLLIVVVSFVFGRCSAPDPIPPLTPEPGVDAGPGESEIAARLDAAVRAEDDRLEELERETALEVSELAEADRAEYEARRARGRDALAEWLKERSRRLLADGGVAR